MKKYLIPNNILTTILTNYMALRRMPTRVWWVNKYLIPNTTLTTIDQLYDTQKIDDEGTVGEKIPNTTLKTYLNEKQLFTFVHCLYISTPLTFLTYSAMKGNPKRTCYWLAETLYFCIDLAIFYQVVYDFIDIALV